MHNFLCAFNSYILLHTTLMTVIQNNLSFLSLAVALQYLTDMSEANP